MHPFSQPPRVKRLRSCITRIQHRNEETHKGITDRAYAGFTSFHKGITDRAYAGFTSFKCSGRCMSTSV